MPSIPAYCPHCGYVFDGRGGIHVENVMNIRLSGNRISCPNCGRMANIVDGVFSDRGNGLEMVEGPPISAAVLRQIKEIAERAQRKDISKQQAVREAAAINPLLAGLLERFLVLGFAALSTFVAFLAYQLQNDAFALQVADSRASAAFYSDALDLLSRQALLHNSSPLENQQHNDRVKKKGEGKPEAKAHEKPPTVERQSERRKNVNRERRARLKAHRMAFGGAALRQKR